MTKTRYEASTSERDELAIKVNNLENKLTNLQHELAKREKECFNSIVAENTEKHLTNLCQTLTSQLEDIRLQLRMSEEKAKRFEHELMMKNERLDQLK